MHGRVAHAGINTSVQDVWYDIKLSPTIGWRVVNILNKQRYSWIDVNLQPLLFFKCGFIFFKRGINMAAQYISYAHRTRPTRNEVIEVLIEMQIELGKITKRLNSIIKRECAHIKKATKQDTKNI